MNFSVKTRYLLVTLAIVTASAIQLARGYKWIVVVVGAVGFLVFGNLAIFLLDSKERAARRKQKRDYYAGVLLVTLLLGAAPLKAQLIGEPPIPTKVKKQKRPTTDLEWMWQYTPPPEGGREHELLQDPHFEPFVQQYFTAPQSFWGPGSESKNPDPRSALHKPLAAVVQDFLAVPGPVFADENRYVSVTGAVRHFPTSRGLIFADLNGNTPLVVFAAIDWIRDSNAVSDPEAQYTLWLFPDRAPGQPSAPNNLPPALVHALTRWMATPLAGSGIVQKITAAILVDADGTPHQIPVPAAAADTKTNEGPVLPKRH